MIKTYPTAIEATDEALEIVYFKMEMFDECSASVKSDVLIGSHEELEDFLSAIRKAYTAMFAKQ